MHFKHETDPRADAIPAKTTRKYPLKLALGFLPAGLRFPLETSG